MTESQRKNLQAIASSISAGHQSVSESFAVGQVMLTTGRPLAKAIEGVKIMQREKVFPTAWIRPDSIGVLERIIAKNPAISNLFDRFDLVPGKTEAIPFTGFCRPKAIDADALKKRFSLPEF